MKEYHKIQTVFKRSPDDNYKTLLVGEYTNPEFEYLQNNIWEFSEKVDGTNVRIIITHEGELCYGGKTDNAQTPFDLLKALHDMFDPMKDALVSNFPEGGIIFGEGYGPGIQKVGRLYRKDKSFVMFDVCVGDWWLRRDQVKSIAEQFSIDIVPVIGTGTLHDLVRIVSGGSLKSYWGDFTAEGIVARPLVELHGRNGERIITKLKVKDFNLCK
jgi:hypothetical protein